MHSLEYAVGEIDVQLAWSAEVQTNYEQILYDSFSFSPPSGGYLNDFGIDSFDNFEIDNSFTLEPYEPFQYDLDLNLDFSFDVDSFVGYSEFNYGSNNDDNDQITMTMTIPLTMPTTFPIIIPLTMTTTFLITILITILIITPIQVSI